MGRGDHLGELEALVLAAVVRVGDAANGTAVYQEIAELTDRDPSLPAIHVTLRRLEEKELLSSELGPASPRGGRPRRFYRPTPAGAQALVAFRRMWRAVWSGMEMPDSGAAQ